MAALDVALTVGAGTLVNVKPSRLGGPLAAVDVARRVGDAGCAAFVGGMLESGIGRASALAVAALPIFGLPADLGPSDRYFEQDVTPPIGLDGRGAVVVPPGPGIGVVPDPEVLAEVTVERSVHTR
jgi:O-succinylbenzoate synthase